MAQDYVITQAYWGASFMPGDRGRVDPSNGAFSWLDMSGAIDALCNSPYFSALDQYGAGSVTFGGPKIAVAQDNPPAQWGDGTQEHGFAERDIENFLVAQIDADTLTAPADWQDGQKPIYLVILPQGLYSRDHFETAVGFHWSFEYRGTRALCAWNMQGGSLNDTTKIVAHEIVEAISSDLNAGELGDACEDVTGIVNHVMVQGYVSKRDGSSCVIPGKLQREGRISQSRLGSTSIPFTK